MNRKNFTFVKRVSIVDEKWEQLKFLNSEHQRNLALLKYLKKLISRTIFHPDGASMEYGEKEVNIFRHLSFRRVLAVIQKFHKMQFYRHITELLYNI